MIARLKVIRQPAVGAVDCFPARYCISAWALCSLTQEAQGADWNAQTSYSYSENLSGRCFGSVKHDRVMCAPCAGKSGLKTRNLKFSSF